MPPAHLPLLLAHRIRLKSREPVSTAFECICLFGVLGGLLALSTVVAVTTETAYNYDAPYPEQVHNINPETLIRRLNGKDPIRTNATSYPFYLWPADLWGQHFCSNNSFAVIFAPKNNATEQLLAYLIKTVPWFHNCTKAAGQSGDGAIFDTVAEALAYCNKGNAYSGKREDGLMRVWALVDTTHLNDEHVYKYTIRMNSTWDSPTGHVPMTYRLVNPVAVGLETMWQRYHDSGFLALQHLIDDWIIYHAAGDKPWVDPIKPKDGIKMSQPTALSTPTRDVVNNQFLQGSAPFMGFLISLIFIFPLARVVRALVEEKFERIKEGLLIMGMSPSAYVWSHILSSWIWLTILSLISAALINVLFKHSFYPVIFLLVESYVIGSTGLSFFLSSLFSKPRNATIGSFIIMFISTLPAIYITTLGPVARIIMSFLPPGCMVQSIATICNAEQVDIGVGFNTIAYGEYPVLWGIIQMLLDALIFHFLAWWVGEVFPGEYGVPKRCWFCFLPSYWRPPKADLAKNKLGIQYSDAEKQHLFESIDGNLDERAVRIDGLRKVFGNNVAVKNLSLEMLQGHITVLLGHNGAGKTTTINMMTGMLPPTDGDCTIFGSSIRDSLGLIRKSIGFCPQHNILWPTCNTREHLTLFAQLKGVEKEHLKDEVDRILTAIGLQDKAKARTTMLSGGMKRRLCVGIAMVGGSKLVFLDEPTAGMDPGARRATWDLLVKAKQDRVILLTTHFMDEADILGDRIAIMSKGNLECVGSPLFLKSRLGVGYNLSFSTAMHANHAKIGLMVEKHVKDAQQLTSNGMELTYLLPMQHAKMFGDLFRELETNQKMLNVHCFGLSLTTLEEVFMKFAAEAEEHRDEDAYGTELDPSRLVNGSLNADKYGSAAVATRDVESRELNENAKVLAAGSHDLDTGAPLLLKQFYGLLVKRFHYSRRDIRFLLCLTVMPVLIVIMALSLALLEFDPPYIALTPEELVMGNNRMDTEFIIGDTMRHHYDWGVSDPTLIPRFVKAKMIQPTVFHNETGKSSLHITKWMMAEYNKHLHTSRFGGVVLNDPVINLSFSDAHNKTVVKPLYFDTLVHNTSSPHTLPIFASILHQARARYHAKNDKIRIETGNFPLPPSPWQKGKNDAIKMVFASILVLVPFSFIPANFASFIVRERACKAKHLQVVSGVRIIMYWAASLVWDMLVYTISVILTMLVFVLFQKKMFIGTFSSFMGTFVLFEMYGLAVINCLYCCSFMFASHSTAQIMLMFMNFLFGVILVIAAQIMGQFESTKATNRALVWVYRIVPSYALGEGIVGAGLLSTFEGGKAVNLWAMDVIGRDLIYLAFEAPIFFALVIFLDFGFSRLISKWWSKARILAFEAYTSSPPFTEDNDVSQETLEVQAGSDNPRVQHDNVVVQRLRHVYPSAPPKIAVHDLSFGVHPDEVFALLGTNGAGKTTTLSILSGEFSPTDGTAYLSGFNIQTELRQAQQNLGYCPQFDAHLDLLTVEEHLVLYARLRGMKSSVINQAVRSAAGQLGLLPFLSIQSKKLSGGNRRKLSMAVSIIGGPSCIFLDEPSAGMDPVARRGTWGAIQAMAEGRSVILTTHHMEEVEALANRIAIMVGGRMMAVGNLQHLKGKYGSGYSLEFRYRNKQDGLKTIQDFILKSFGDLQVEETKPGWVRFKVLERNLKLSEMFTLIEDHREELDIEDYSVCQPTLEQVFLRISNEGNNGPGNLVGRSDGSFGNSLS